jgi:hypothetical protein
MVILMLMFQFPVKGDRHIVVDTSMQPSKEIAKAIALMIVPSSTTTIKRKQ